ncbi:phosphatidylinositol 4-phosphate 5-kinase 5-like [Macadamia integrifolia]|uniref:phosphatidylinositol 4-phosphate 5-kinase 5-like n=1 Tax=Macadamia integrifolia TaxID=60698 RepID=UPI001C4EBA01|nr:phosphatidylinositol 4-phosphate 5-kinase 5-like [Macadamia integrifolia]
MEVQKSQAKLTRTQSSLIRSPSTIRSSIHNLSFIRDEEAAEEEEKPHKSISGVSNRFMNRSNRLIPVLGTVLLSFSFFFFYFYLRREEILNSENLLFALVFIAVALYFGGKNKGFVIKTALFLKQFWDVKNKKLEISKRRHESVEWFIGNGGSSSFKKEKIVREGLEFYSNGDFYEGEFHKGRCNGSGVYYYVLNGKYEGDWIDGRYEGYGIENWARGSKYRGQYRQGLRHGYGVYRFYTGDSYAGEWFNGQSHGMGVQTCSDGSCYVGEFKCGVKHGLGCYHFRNGDTYGGEYFGDKIHGFGVYHFANGHCYEGSWHEGQKHGFGMYTFRNGDARCGELDAGVLKTSLPPLTDAVLRAVQSARKEAENASRLPPVDDLVKKAVITANRAATAARVAAIKAVQNRIDGKFCDMDI